MAQPTVEQFQIGTIDADSVNGATVGSGANQIVQLDGSGNLPALDASQLVNLPTSAYGVTVSNDVDPTVVPANTTTIINLSTIRDDMGGAGADYDSVTNLFTPTKAGWYAVGVSVLFSPDAVLSGVFSVSMGTIGGMPTAKDWIVPVTSGGLGSVLVQANGVKYCDGATTTIGGYAYSTNSSTIPVPILAGLNTNTYIYAYFIGE